MSEEKFKLPVSSYDELVKYIKAYSHITKPTDLSEISKMTGCSIPNISACVGFMLATGILEGGKKKMITPKGQQLGQALEHEISDEISKSWRSIVEESEFLKKLITSVRIRKGMDSQTLESHIAYSAGQPKKSWVMTGARTIIDILKAAEFIVEIDGKFMPKDSNELDENQNIQLNKNETQREQLPNIDRNTPLPESYAMKTQQGVSINIQININCSPDNVPGLGNQVRAMIQEITSSENSEADGDK